MYFPMDIKSKIYVIPGAVFASAVALFTWELCVSFGAADLLAYAAGFGCLVVFAVAWLLATAILYNARMHWMTPETVLPYGLSRFLVYPVSAACGVALAAWVFLTLAAWHAAVLVTLYVTLVTFASAAAVVAYNIGSMRFRLRGRM